MLLGIDVFLKARLKFFLLSSSCHVSASFIQITYGHWLKLLVRVLNVFIEPQS